MSSMKYYVLQRILLAIPMFFILISVIFFVLRIMPGDPVLAMLGGKAPQEVIEAKREKLGLNKPIGEQFVIYVGNLLKGDLGKSMLTRRPVNEEIAERFPATLELTLWGFIIAVVIGIFWGSEASRNREKTVDLSARVYAIFIYSVPVFWFGMIMQLVFGVWLGWLPVSGRLEFIPGFYEKTGFLLIDTLIDGNMDAFFSAIRHLVLPAVSLGVVISSIFLRMVRGNMILTLTKDFIKAAKARGIRRGAIVYRHALKNSFVPILTVMGLQFALLLAGAVLTETTFSWPGIGTFLVKKIKDRDFISIQGTIVIFALLVISVSIIIDIINAWIDPRIRY